MADNHREKRQRTASEAGRGSASDDDDALESENHALRSEDGRPRSEVADHRERLLHFEGDRDAQASAVDLSRFDTSLVAQIACFVGNSFELLKLSLTCKAFGWRQPSSGMDWSLIEEVARRAVTSALESNQDARITLSRRYARGTTSWLSVLNEYEHPLKFDILLGGSIAYDPCACGERDVVIMLGEDESSAVASGYVMKSGIHYAEFDFYRGIIIGIDVIIGIVRPLSNLDVSEFADSEFSFFDEEMYGEFLAARTIEWGNGDVHACSCSASRGMIWTNWADRTEESEHCYWEGMECLDDFINPVVFGMLLNLDEGTLTVYVGGHRVGVMKRGLSGSYCWYATLFDEGNKVEISKVDIAKIRKKT